MKLVAITFTFLTALLFACNNPDQKPIIKNMEVQKKNTDSGFKVTSVKHEQHYSGTFNFQTKKAKVDNNSKTEISVDYLIKISEKEILITDREGKDVDRYTITHKEDDKKDGVLVYDTKNSDGKRYQVSHLVNDDGTYSYFEFRSTDSLKFYTTI